MNWYSIFYWFSVSDKINTFVTIFAGVLTGIAVICFFVKVFSEDGTIEHRRSKSIFNWSVPIASIFWLFFLFIPSKKQMLLIVAGGSVGNFIQGDSSIQKFPADVTKYLHLSMKKEIENLSSETKEELGIATPKDKLLNKAKDMTREQLIEFIKADTSIIK